MKTFRSKKLVLVPLFVLVFSYYDVLAQKLPIDNTTYADWQHVAGRGISNNGRYIFYSIEKGVGFFPITTDKFVVKSTKKDWKIELTDIKERPKFTEDSKYLLARSTSKELSILRLGSSTTESIKQVNDYQIPEDGDGQWLAYRSKDVPDELILRSLLTKKELSFSNVSEYEFIFSGKALMLRGKEFNDNSIQTIRIVDLQNKKEYDIYKGRDISNIVFDQHKAQFAFASRAEHEIQFLRYKCGAAAATVVAHSGTPGIDKGLELDRIDRFANIGSRLFLTLKERVPDKKVMSENPKLNVWSYRDEKLQSEQLNDLGPKSYVAVLDLDNLTLLRLTKDNESVSFENYVRDGNGNDEWVSLEKRSFTANIDFNQRFEYALLSTLTGELKNFDHKFSISPGGKYLIYFDEFKNCYYSYETATAKTRNITQYINTRWKSYSCYDETETTPRGIAGWLTNDEGILIYDRNDIWLVDPLARKVPENLTNAYGKKNDFVFNLSEQEYPKARAIYKINQSLILVAFNKLSKDNGFCKINMNKRSDPELLTMGPYSYYIPDRWGEAGGSGGREPLKAKNAEAYLFQRESSTTSPNYFFTKDFKSSQQLSSIYPEKRYNWYTTELHSWQTATGHNLQGILYKPGNFDPSKKYPVLFYHYNTLSDNLNVFIDPELSDGRINIAWFVDNGYLVFTPDVYFTKGRWAECATDALESAAKHIRTLPYVNASKIGIEGESHGGDMTFDVIVRSKLFAAACSVTGCADRIAQYHTLSSVGGNILPFSEIEINDGIWKNRSGYIENSAVFHADKVVTPLLIMNGRQDVRFNLSLEMFLDLRRLGKPSWFLDYEESGHGASTLRDQLDFSRRMMQFFDHYLKDKPAPVWMTRGIPAKLKGIETGLEIDESGTKLK